MTRVDFPIRTKELQFTKGCYDTSTLLEILFCALIQKILYSLPLSANVKQHWVKDKHRITKAWELLRPEICQSTTKSTMKTVNKNTNEMRFKDIFHFWQMSIWLECWTQNHWISCIKYQRGVLSASIQIIIIPPLTVNAWAHACILVYFILTLWSLSNILNHMFHIITYNLPS